ncbi:MAG TPA: nickel-dependent lactate racemase [Planctomycetes bacterium]|nr:nickel-dependent lactate racemase [Planctomycetota bacterium]
MAGLLCGEERIPVTPPTGAFVLEMEDLEPLADPEAAVEEALARPIASPPLGEIARGKKTACVVVSDITRPVPNPVILPPLLATLERSGISREDITILVATGNHRPNLGEELERLLGPETARSYRVVNNKSREAGDFREVDRIEGSPVEIHKAYLDADLKILTGLVEPHFYAGYSGGAKAVVPGISSFETMRFMHSFRMIDHPGVTSCRLEGNPFHQACLQVAEKVGVDFLLNVVINRDRKTAGVFAGHYDKAHLEACALVERHSVREVPGPVDLVVTSGGGFPLDATFYQVSKGLVCGDYILEEGGEIFVAAECREGLGSPEFTGILRTYRNRKEFDAYFSDPSHFVVDQWCAQNIYQVLDHAGKVHVYSPNLERKDLEFLGMDKVEDPAGTLRDLFARHERVALIPDGPYVIGRLEG